MIISIFTYIILSSISANAGGAGSRDLTSSGVVTSSSGPKHPPTTPTTTPTSSAATTAVAGAIDPNSPQQQSQQQPHHKSVKRSASALPSAAQDHRGGDPGALDRPKVRQNATATADRGGQNLPLTTTPSSTPRNTKTAPAFCVKELDSAPSSSRHTGTSGTTPLSSTRSSAVPGTSPTYQGSGQPKRQVSTVKSSPSSHHQHPANSQSPSQLPSQANNDTNVNGTLDVVQVYRGVILIPLNLIYRVCAVVARIR